MPTYTSSLSQDLINRLSKVARELSLPKNAIIAKALDIYLTEIDKAAFAASFRKASDDQDLLAIAEEGMADYVQQLIQTDEAD